MKKGESLKFGQIVSISPLEFQSLFLFSDGFIRDTAILTEIQEETLASGCRFAQCLFKIYPSFITSRLQQAIDLKEELMNPRYEDEAKRAQKIQEAQQKVIVEYKMNIETAQKLKDVPLSFNSGIQFLHIATNKFLTCNYTEAEQEKENFRLELMEFPSSRSCFRLLPAFQHQFGQEAQIYAGDSTYIALDQLYIGNSSMLHIAKDERKVNLEKYLKNRQLFPIPNLNLLDRINQNPRPKSANKDVQQEGQIRKQTLRAPTSLRHINQSVKKDSLQREVNVSLEQSSAWIVKIYENQNDDENIIRYGDIIWINQIEENSILCMLRNEKDELMISYQDQGQNLEGFQGNSNGMFQVEAEDMKLGGHLEWGTTIRLRHLSIGKYLAICVDKTINATGSYLLYLADTPTPNTMFQLVALPSSDPGSKNVTKDAFFKLKTSGTGKHYWVHLERQKQYRNISQGNQNVIEEDIPFISCRLSETSEDEDVMKLYKAHYSEVIETNFLLTCFPVLRKSLSFFQTSKNNFDHNDKRERLNVIVSQLCKVLEELNRFCNNEMINTQLDMKANKRANIARQRTLREQFFIEIMIEIMKIITSEEELKKYDDHQRKLHTNQLIRQQEKDKEFSNKKSQLDNSQTPRANNQEISEQVSLMSVHQKSSTIVKLLQMKGKQSPQGTPTNLNRKKDFILGTQKQINQHQKPIVQNLTQEQANDDDQSDISQEEFKAEQIMSPHARNELSKLLKSSGIGKQSEMKSPRLKSGTSTPMSSFKRLVQKQIQVNCFIQKSSEAHIYIILNQKVHVLKLIYKLLTSICSENEDNQNYVYRKFNKFLYQAQYIREATDCIIKILGGNEIILSNLCDDIKLNEKKKQQKKLITTDQSDSSMGDIWQDDELEFNMLDMDNVNNNVLLYYKHMTEQQIKQRNIQYIQFFRAICRFKETGITDNQEMIFKFIKQNEEFKNSLFMPIIIETTTIKVQTGPRNIIYLTSVKDPEIYNYLVSQLYLYADLALQRNFLWKSYLQQIFPIQFVFNQIFDENMKIDYRSAFCNIALSIYVDHEPFNKIIVPGMCRLVIPDQNDESNKYKKPKMNAQRKQKFISIIDKFEFLIDHAFLLVKNTCILIEQELQKQYNLKILSLIVKIDHNTENHLTNQLIYDMMNMINVIITFDIVSMIKKNDKQSDFFPNLVKMLEFDRTNMLFSFILQLVRKNKIAKAEESQNKLNALKSALGTAVLNLSEVGKRLTTSILGISKKSQDSLEVEFAEYDTTVISRNPIVGSLVTITNQIGQINTQNEKHSNDQFYDLEIKIKICEIINFFQDQRQDYFIENFLCYYKDIGTKFIPIINNHDYNKLLHKEIKEELVQVLPPLLRTGIELIDNQAKNDSESLWEPDTKDLMAVGALLKSNKVFHNFLSSEVPDLDTLMSGTHANIMKSELLPSLLISFYMTSDMDLQDKLIQLMRRCFSQKKELLKYLSQVEILFDTNDIQSYQYLQNTIQNLKSLTECSEVWLVDFLAEPKAHNKEIYKVLKMVQDIHSFLWQGTVIDEQGRIIPGKPVVSLSRQKIFFYLDIHIPILNYIRDTQNQLTKVSRDPFFSQETKDLSTKILASMYAVLTDFCRGNEFNQNYLIPHIQLFLNEIDIEMGQIDLICAIFKDNKLQCERISEQLLSQFLALIKIFGRQERFLRLFIVIQSFKSHQILENQIKVRKLFIPKSQAGSGEFTDIHEYQFYGEFVNNSLQFDFTATNSIQKDEPYTYHGTLLDMLLETVKGEEGFKLNIPHLKRIFNLNYFLILLMKQDNMFQVSTFDLNNLQIEDEKDVDGNTRLKSKIVKLLTKIYINNTVVDQFLFIKEQSTFSALFTQERIRFDSLQCSKEYMIYFFDDLIVMMKYYSEKLIQKDTNGEFRERDDYQQLIAIANSVLDKSNDVLCNRLNAIQYNNLIKFIYSVDEQFFKLNAGHFSRCLEQVSLPKSRKASSADNDFDLKELQLKTIFSRTKPEFIGLLQNTPDDLKTRAKGSSQRITPHGDLPEEPTEWFSQKNWEHFLRICNNSKQFKKEVQIELDILGQCFQKIGLFLPEQIVKELSLDIKFKDVLRKLIRFVEMGVINRSDKQNLLFTLEVLGNILTTAPDLEVMQNLFDSCQSTRMFLNLLADFQTYPFDDDLLLQLLKFACIATKGGNIQVQQTIFNYLANFENSEQILFKMHSIIYEVIQDQQEIQRAKQQLEVSVEKAQFQNVYLMQSERSSITKQEEDEADLLEFKKMKQSILIQLLQFLQLMCEGHNLEIQNYLRYQYNSRNNYNIVQAMVELLWVFQTDLQKEGFEVIMNTLETLTELVQGPCSKNQQDIIDSQFLDVASYILSMHNKKHKGGGKQSIQSDKSEDKIFKDKSNTLNSGSKSNYGGRPKQNEHAVIEKWMLERLKYKCMVLITSLLELNSDEMAIQRIMRSLPINVLKENQVTVFKRYTKLYGNVYSRDVLNHIYADPEDRSVVHPKGYHELIIETGFFIYFLICYYADLSIAEIDLETTQELAMIKQDKNNPGKNALADMKNNIIGQLLSLAYALIEGILDTINSIRSYVQSKIQQTFDIQEVVDPEKKAILKKIAEQALFKQSIKFFSTNSSSIEVVRNGQLERIVFYKPSYCNYIPKESRTEFNEDVDRDSANSKIRDLMNHSLPIIEICKHEEDLAIFFNKNKFIAIFANYVILWKDLAFIMTITLNLLIIMSFYAGTTGTFDDQYYVRIWRPQFLKTVLNSQQTDQLFRVCGCVMIVCSSFVVLFFLMKKGPIYARDAWNEHSNLIKKEQPWIIRKFLALCLMINSLFRVLMNMEVFYYLMYGTLAFIATFFHPFFFAFHLSEVVLRYPVLRNVIKSFWEPKMALFLTLVLTFLFNYYFTLISYTYLSGLYTNGKCDSLIVCFLATFDYAFKNNGGIGGYFNAASPQSSASYSYAEFFYDQFNNIVIQLIMIHIFSGIIVDTFGSLREKQQTKVSDVNEICFICGLQRELFDRRPDYGFPQHIKEEHYMWNYLFYIAYLLDKNKAERNGIETYISGKMKNQDNSWFPIGQAIGLQGGDVDSQVYQAEKIKEVEVRVMTNMKKNISTITECVTEISSMMVS